MKKLLLLLLGSAVQCERREEIIGRIQTLDIGTQAALASAIQEVTQKPKNVLKLHWKQLEQDEMEELLQDVMSQIPKVVQQRDAALEKLWDLQQEKETPAVSPTNKNCQHLGVQLAEARAQVRRLQHQLEEKMEEQLDLQDELKDLEAQLQHMREENRRLTSEARLTVLYRDELDALREKVLRTERLQTELAALRGRLPVLEQYQAQLKEEREFSQALLDTKAMLEEQLEAACARSQQVKHLEAEKKHLQSSLNQMKEERDQISHQREELLRENLDLERQLEQGLKEPLDALRSEEVDQDCLPKETSDISIFLGYEMKESGRLLALEQENQKLRRRLQEMFERMAGSESLDPASENTILDGKLQSPENPLEPKMEEQPSLKSQEEQKQEVVVPEKGTETDERMARMAAALLEAQAQFREAEEHREKASHRVVTLENRLRSLQEAHEKHKQERMEWHLETERLVEEVQALEREQEALQAGSQALQAVAARTELELAETKRRLQGEQLKGAQLAQKAQQTEEDLCEARQELEMVQRILEQHKVALAQLEAEKALLEDLLSQAEAHRRQLDKDNRQLKAQAQAQEKALEKQKLRLVHLEGQSRQQVMELNSLQEVAQGHKELETEVAGLREQLEAKHEALAILEEELQREKEKRSKETISIQLKESLLEKKGSFQIDVESRKGSKEQQEGPSDKRLKEESSTHRSQSEERQDLMSQNTSNHQFLEKLPMNQVLETPSELNPDLLPLHSEAHSKALSARLNEVECKNTVLQAEKFTLIGRLSQLESQISNLQGSLLGLQGQNSEVKEESGKWQSENNALKVEAASLHFQKASLESQISDLRQRQSALEAEAQRTQREREEWRARYEALLRDHDRLTVLHERQGADLEELLGKHVKLKGNLRRVEQESRELQDRHSQLLGQKANLEHREEALRGQKVQLEEAVRHQRELEEQHNNLKEEHDWVKQTLAQKERGWDELQEELRGMRNRVTGLQLDHARLEAESAALKEQNQQLDTALGRLSTQCELLAQLKGNQEEENRHLLQEIQALSRENRRLLEHSMESKEHFQEEQRQYLDKLGELRREKQKLVEKIMDQYRVLDPALPRGKKSSWIAEKIRKLMKPRRDTPRDQLRPMAEGAGSNESLAGQEGPEVDGRVSSTPSSPAPLRKASSTLSISDAQQVHFRRRRLSSRLPVVGSPGDGESMDSPRQRFRQHRLGMLGGSREEAVLAATEWEAPSEESTTSHEKSTDERTTAGEEEKAPQ
ncbi:coiled-coil domain-containing protein 88B [Anolis sagrei]|uniref:coiled-coil domain-containing protein 88B n=1 Tax=Anolis sagrei TaxID=38937 RepID=UPI003522420D